DSNQIARSMLVGIIRPRIEEILELVCGKLEETGFDNVAGPRVVLTGGASQLTGVRELTGEILNKQVRMGGPANLSGLAESANVPAFSAAAGLIQFTLNERAAAAIPSLRTLEAPNSRLGRIGQWIREKI
ncbi:MAG: cell division protein FtsA, partial [Rhodospirillales bacterium]|nr:cell division protein FtsA [Rhodospirillales bacterium]